MGSLGKARDWLLELLYPTRCLLCRKPMERGRVQLCPRCQERLPFIEPGSRGGFPCVAPFEYREPLRELFLRYKFQGKEHYAATFGVYLSQAVEEELSGEFDLVTWVPLRPFRRWRRGYDQARLLAQAVAKDSGQPLAPTLAKGRRTKTQSHLTEDSARRRNVRGAYQVREKAPVRGRRVLLIDDICTSGATMETCVEALLAAGAESVACAALARRPGR